MTVRRLGVSTKVLLSLTFHPNEFVLLNSIIDIKFSSSVSHSVTLFQMCAPLLGQRLTE